MVTLVDYGLGNIQAFAHVYKRLNIPVTTAKSVDELRDADKIVLPGVGAFDWAMEKLDASKMRGKLDELVQDKKVPVLGVCVGMQMMAQSSEEGHRPGLGWIDAEVKRFRANVPESELKLPHMGWNDVEPRSHEGLFHSLETPRFYFLHSYFFAPNDPQQALAATDYHGSFTSAVASGNVYGVQFHPEKSHGWGIQLLKNFAEL